LSVRRLHAAPRGFLPLAAGPAAFLMLLILFFFLFSFIAFVFISSVFFVCVIFFSSIDLQETEVTVLISGAEVGLTFEVCGALVEEHTESLSRTQPDHHSVTTATRTVGFQVVDHVSTLASDQRRVRHRGRNECWRGFFLFRGSQQGQCHRRNKFR